MAVRTLTPAEIEYDRRADALIDSYHEGWKRGPCPYTDPELRESWQQGQRDAERARKTRPIMPARPEGYYHAPIGTFD